MSNPTHPDTIDFAMFAPVPGEAEPLRTKEEKQAIARKAIDRDAKAAYEKEIARLDMKRMEAGADEFYASGIEKAIHKLYEKLDARSAYLKEQGINPVDDTRHCHLREEIAERTGILTAMGRKVSPPLSTGASIN